jgi:hypothetical protein
VDATPRLRQNSAASGNALHPQLYLMVEATIILYNFIQYASSVVSKWMNTLREGLVSLYGVFLMTNYRRNQVTDELHSTIEANSYSVS